MAHFRSLLLSILVLLGTGCLSSEGFIEGGAWSGTTHPPPLFWGSYGPRGDGDKGRLEIAMPPLAAEVTLRMAGYPSGDRIRVFVRDSAGEELTLRFRNPGETWAIVTQPVPADWQGRSAKLVLVDDSEAAKGWVAVELPPNGRVLNWRQEWARPFWIALILVGGLALLEWHRRAPRSSWPHQIAYLTSAVLLLFHFLVLTSYAVDIPIFDEWEALLPNALDRRLDVDWLFRLHNEHRIVTTKLITWLLYRIGDWNLVVQITINFFVYVTLIYGVCRLAAEHLGVETPIVALLAASTISAENLTWAFQTQFHLFLAFFVFALLFALRGGWWAWAGVVCAVLSAYSFSTGVICGVSTAAVYVYLGITKPEARRRRVVQALIILIAVGAWFSGFHTNPLHPVFAMPWTDVFWAHYLNGLSNGFGYRELSIWPGIGLILWFIAGVAYLYKNIMRDPRRDGWVAMIVLGLTILAGLGAISLARGPFGAAQAKASRYAEVAFMLVPLAYVLGRQLVMQIRAGALRLLVSLALLGALVAPFLDDFDFPGTYGGYYYHVREDARRCVTRFYAGKGDGSCPAAYPANISTRLERAKELGVSFARTAGSF